MWLRTQGILGDHDSCIIFHSISDPSPSAPPSNIILAHTHLIDFTCLACPSGPMISHFCISVAWLISNAVSPHYVLSPLPGNQALLQKAMTVLGLGSVYYHALSSPLCPWGVFYLVTVCSGSLLPSGCSLVAASGGCSPVAVHRLLLVVAFLVVWALGCVAFGSCSSQALELWLSSCGPGAYLLRDRCEISPDQGLNPRLLHWQADALPLRPQGSPLCVFISYFSLTAFLEYFYEQLHQIIFPIFQKLNSLLLPAQMMCSILRLSLSPVFTLKLIFLTGIWLLYNVVCFCCTVK